jgi:hypothetical protein
VKGTCRYCHSEVVIVATANNDLGKLVETLHAGFEEILRRRREAPLGTDLFVCDDAVCRRRWQTERSGETMREWAFEMDGRRQKAERSAEVDRRRRAAGEREGEA